MWSKTRGAYRSACQTAKKELFGLVFGARDRGRGESPPLQPLREARAREHPSKDMDLPSPKRSAMPLLSATWNGHLEIVRVLLDANAAVDEAGNNGWTPLYIAAQNGYPEIVAALLDANATVDLAINDGATPLFVACQLGHVDIARCLIERGHDIEAPVRGNGWTPLFAAAWSGKESVVSALLSAGANATAATTADHRGIPAGSTPLSVASQKGHAEVVAVLLGERA